VMVIAGQVLLVLVLRKRAGRRLRTELNELGHTVCIACGYNLTGNLTGICPECGHHSSGSMPAGRLPESQPFKPDSV
jgi:rubrerythrin